MTKVLFDVRLSEREFGSQALAVSALEAWAGRLPPTEPDVADFDVVQIEALLSSMANGVEHHYSKHSTTDVIQAALEIADLDLKVRERLIQEGSREIAIWKLTGAVPSYWRERINAAVAKGELLPFDSITMQPIGGQVQASAQKQLKAPERHGNQILAAISRRGLNAMALPKHKNGARNSPKSQVKEEAVCHTFTERQFETGWTYLLQNGKIKEASQ